MKTFAHIDKKTNLIIGFEKSEEPQPENEFIQFVEIDEKAYPNFLDYQGYSLAKMKGKSIVPTQAERDELAKTDEQRFNECKAAIQEIKAIEDTQVEIYGSVSKAPLHEEKEKLKEKINKHKLKLKEKSE
ncbi:MAG: hypothetical protein ACRC0V_09715 [Fusobacteriaceae bacterium]